MKKKLTTKLFVILVWTSLPFFASSQVNPYLISAGNSGDAYLKIESDLDNNNESDNSWIELKQDGGTLGAYIGFNMNWGSGESAPDNLFRIGSRYSNGDNFSRFVMNCQTGNIGIGTAVPSEPLHVKDASGSFTFGRPNSEMNNRFTLDASSGYENQIYFRLGKGRMFTSGNNLILGTTPSAEHIVILANSGNVGIGTSTTGTHKLAVEGTIGAREIKVETTAWPDYVFEPNYELLSLTQTKEYIEANKHLPEVPSATEMEQNGVALGEMNVLLLKKIEELTLHQIALMETVDGLKKEIGDLKNSRK